MVRYVCIACTFNSISKSDYSRHIKTKKHKKHTVTGIQNDDFIFFIDICIIFFN